MDATRVRARLYHGIMVTPGEEPRQENSSMSENPFDHLDRAIAEGGPAPAFEYLAESFREQKNYPMLFETRLMQIRLELGLPLISADPSAEPQGALRKQYEERFIQAAREIGWLFLNDGEIARAWPYFRAINEHTPIIEAIEKVEPGETVDPVIEIAFQERVHPRKGFELLLRQYGLCRAITFFHQYPDANGRQESLALLLNTLYRDLTESLKRTISSVEGSAPEGAGVRELIAGRDWLFGEYDYYVDTSHLVSILRFAMDVEDRELLAKAVELAEYGNKLSPMFHFRGDPPFEKQYEDYGAYLKALATGDAEPAVQHFRAKLESSEDTSAAQVLVVLLAKLKKYEQAVDLSLEFLQGVPPSQLMCPSVPQLCQMAGDFSRLKGVARQEDDLLTYAAAALQAMPKEAVGR
jgi:hypothetical protein